MGEKLLRVVIVEDHVVVCEGLKLLLQHEVGIAVVGDAATGLEGVALCERLAADGGVDVVVTDLGLPDIGGLEVARRIKARQPATRILLLSAQVDDEAVQGLLEAGCDGYLLKYVAGRELAQAIRSVAGGETILSPIVARRLMERLNPAQQLTRRVDTLTDREQEVLRLLAGGATSKEVAQRLGLRPKTVENHRARILEKLNAANTPAAINLAIHEGLLSAQ